MLPAVALIGRLIARDRSATQLILANITLSTLQKQVLNDGKDGDLTGLIPSCFRGFACDLFALGWGEVACAL